MMFLAQHLGLPNSAVSRTARTMKRSYLGKPMYNVLYLMRSEDRESGMFLLTLRSAFNHNLLALVLVVVQVQQTSIKKSALCSCSIGCTACGAFVPQYICSFFFFFFFPPSASLSSGFGRPMISSNSSMELIRFTFFLLLPPCMYASTFGGSTVSSSSVQIPRAAFVSRSSSFFASDAFSPFTAMIVLCTNSCLFPTTIDILN
mmetsp:Transcript_15905/g.39356  ORF Transcript_15905/g.39356 Transcript_15905/m.39356 type:complete len:203 (-) Transcript_15905:2372-2980(-)